ncbi:hypothetical protein MNQ98_17510 [Paenibacillus sp. N3/727]|uniref:hypothetical protein n=1 Tax=Paenibacillus sp. N3/727 TaxID=2925845 RepID=UPI001F53CBBB|nr:hypothetical protein [Paenibacillus sp. N3/727]UNK16316.1 hypothetical protein MNQ98_17510 [Paenibacillus sp. N3/727]
MDNKYLNKYIELSKDFKSSNKSPQSIEKLYEFSNTLKTAKEEQARLVLSYVFSLLGYHKSAYDIFLTVSDSNNRKDQSKLFEMKKLADSHGDHFIIKRVKNKAVQKMEKLTMANIKKKDEQGSDWQNYEIDKSIMIFGSPFDGKSLGITVHNDVELTNSTNTLTEYIDWLGLCKDVLQKFYNEEFEDEADDEWYESLEVYRVQVTVINTGDTFAEITCGDNIWSDHLLDIEFNGKEIETMGYDG